MKITRRGFLKLTVAGFATAALAKADLVKDIVIGPKPTMLIFNTGKLEKGDYVLSAYVKKASETERRRVVTFITISEDVESYIVEYEVNKGEEFSMFQLEWSHDVAGRTCNFLPYSESPIIKNGSIEYGYDPIVGITYKGLET